MRARLITTFAVLLVGLAGQVHAEDSSVSSEYLIKAGFIYNFARLVEWPQSSFPQPDSPIVIGIEGTDPFGNILERVLDGKKVNGHGFVIRRLKSLASAKECHILFISASETGRLDEVIRVTNASPVLTISEIPGFANHGGMINLVLEDNKVRFEVNVEAAREADLNISSRLLALAKIVQQPNVGR
jgi:YfiR/HmsC-like